MIKILAGAASVAAGGCGSGQPQPDGATTADTEIEASLDSIVGAARGKHPFVGAAISLIRNGRVVLTKGYGHADRKTRVPVTSQTIFRVGSVTKQFTASLIVALAEKGRLDLEMEVSQLVPGAPTQGRRITLRNLLTHTAGIYNYTDAAYLLREAFPITPAEIIATFASKPLDFEPGARWSYSNSNYLLLALAAERAAQLPWARALRTLVLDPLRLVRTGVLEDDRTSPDRAVGYVTRDGGVESAPPCHISTAFGAGDVSSSAEELARWLLGLHQGRVVTPAGVDAMTSPTSVATGGAYPYGFGLGLSAIDEVPAIVHAGDITGFRAAVAWFPQRQAGVVVLLNTQCEALSQLAHGASRLVLGLPPPRIDAVPIPRRDLDRYCGTYDVAGPTWSWTVRRQGELLYAIPAASEPSTSAREPLLHLGEHVFLRSGAPDRRMAFLMRDGVAVSVEIDDCLMRFPAQRVSQG